MNGANGSATGAKPPLLLLHGFPGTPVMWEPLLPYLTPHHEVHAIALPGHHGGPPLHVGADEHVVETMADAVERQMDELGLDRAHIAGNSLGGWLSLLLTDRGRAISTVAIAPAGGWSPGLFINLRTLLIFRRTQLALGTIYGLLNELAARPRSRRLLFWDTVAYPARLPGPLAQQWLAAAADTPILNTVLKQSPHIGAPKALPGATGPIRVAWGTKDRLLPFERTSKGWRPALADAEWVMLPGLGHVPMSDDPELVAKTILEVTSNGANGAN
ncbi:MAG: alpha/beta hydrolase [Actinobacteria bacterium]|nr:alpha/beta hydrolase [Actinomycetota bacterium]